MQHCVINVMYYDVVKIVLSVTRCLENIFKTHFKSYVEVLVHGSENNCSLIVLSFR